MNQKISYFLRKFTMEQIAFVAAAASMILSIAIVLIVELAFFGHVNYDVLTTIAITSGLVSAGVIASYFMMRRTTYEESSKSSSLLRAALESTADGILIVDRKGRIMMFNQQFQQMWRIPQEVADSKDDGQAIAFVLGQLVDPEAFLKKVRKLYSTDDESFDTLVFKDGRVFERYSRPQRIGRRVVGRVWSFRDVTERTRNQEELQNKTNELERVNKAFVGRELRMIELKKDIEAARKQL